MSLPSGLFLQRLELGPMQNFVYLLGAEESPETAVIDAAWDVDAILRAASDVGRRITHALVSHRHHDHTNGLAPLLERQPVQVIAHEADAPALERSLGTDAVTRVRAGAVINVGLMRLSCIHTPGHTPGSQCFHLDHGDGALFSGDTVFVNACGRCDLEGGDAATMYDSLTRVLGALDTRTLLFPGHDYGDVKASTLARERERNPYFQFTDAADFVGFRNRPRR